MGDVYLSPTAQWPKDDYLSSPGSESESEDSEERKGERGQPLLQPQIEESQLLKRYQAELKLLRTHLQETLRNLDDVQRERKTENEKVKEKKIGAEAEAQELAPQIEALQTSMRTALQVAAVAEESEAAALSRVLAAEGSVLRLREENEDLRERIEAYSHEVAGHTIPY